MKFWFYAGEVADAINTIRSTDIICIPACKTNLNCYR